MAKYFGFIDETGALYNDPQQRFFAIGLIKCEETATLSEQLRVLKDRVLSAKGSVKGQTFEFKFNKIKKNDHIFYYDLIDLYFQFSKMHFCCLIIDKQNPKIQIDQVFGGDTWNAYISFSKNLIENNVKLPDTICILADFVGRPKVSKQYYEPDIKKLPAVYNACMLESHASLIIQVVDVLIGAVAYDFKRSRIAGWPVGTYKSKVVNFLRKKLKVNSLANSFTQHLPSYFSVWEFCPK